MGFSSFEICGFCENIRQFYLILFKRRLTFAIRLGLLRSRLWGPAVDHFNLDLLSLLS